MPYPLKYAPSCAIEPQETKTRPFRLLRYQLFISAALYSLLSLSACALTGCYSVMPLEEEQAATTTATDNSTANSDLAYDAATAAAINLNATPATKLTFDYNRVQLTTVPPQQTASPQADAAPSSTINLTTQATATSNQVSDTTATYSYSSRAKPLEYNKYHPAPLHSVTPPPKEKSATQEHPTRYYYDSYYDFDPFYYDQPWRGVRGTYLSPYYYYRHHHGLRGGLYLNLH